MEALHYERRKAVKSSFRPTVMPERRLYESAMNGTCGGRTLGKIWVSIDHYLRDVTDRIELLCFKLTLRRILPKKFVADN